MGEVSVDLAALTTFARKVGGLSDYGGGDTKRLTTDMGQHVLDGSGSILHASVVDVDMRTHKVGSATFSEAIAFYMYHKVVAESVQKFLLDVSLGTACLAAGAETCAINYANVDEFNARNMNKAGSGYLPLGGSANVTSDDVNALFSPKKDNALFNTDTGADPGTTTDQGADQSGGGKGHTNDKPDKGPAVPPGTYAPNHTLPPDNTQMPVPDNTPDYPGRDTGVNGTEV